MNKFSTAKICRAGIIASIYFIFTYVFQAISFGLVQVRIAEALTVLPLFFAEAVPALFIGCFLSNLISGFGAYDLFLGSLATLLAGILTRIIGKKIKGKLLKFILGVIPPIVINAFFVPVIIYLGGGVVESYFIQVLIIGIEQSLAIIPVGGFLYFALFRLKEKNPNSPMFCDKTTEK